MRRLYTIFCILLLSIPVYSQEQGERSLIEMNRTVLSRVKQSIRRGDAEYMKAYQNLITDADGMLSQGPYTVTTKKQLPPSGDMHDYVSRGPYWWPDPDKPDGLPYIRKDGLINPEYYDFPDRDQLGKLTRSVHTLGLAYYFTEDERYAAHAASLVKAWFMDEKTKMNPNLNYGQQIPGVCDGRGIGLIDTPSFVQMLDGVILISSSPSWTKDDEERLKSWFAQFRKWMLTSKNGQDEAKQHNNHGTYYDLQIVAYSIFTGQTAFARNYLQTVTAGRLDSQLAADMTGLQHTAPVRRHNRLVHQSYSAQICRMDLSAEPSSILDHSRTGLQGHR